MCVCVCVCVCVCKSSNFHSKEMLIIFQKYITRKIILSMHVSIVVLTDQSTQIRSF